MGRGHDANRTERILHEAVTIAVHVAGTMWNLTPDEAHPFHAMGRTECYPADNLASVRLYLDANATHIVPNQRLLSSECYSAP